MVAYEFYWHDEIKGYELIGILPERRKSPERITHESIMKWGRKVIGDNAANKNIFFIHVTIDRTTGRIFRPDPSFRAEKQD
jgi:hypothetical protein